ncbi:MAG: hypothetical protein ABI690_12820 [Chloroflexota bacterium]
MSTPWNSLYCPSEDAGAIAHSLQDSLTALGYQPYNPFGAMPGKMYAQTVRLFVAPPADGWTRIIGAPDDGQFSALSQLFACLYIQLDGAEGRIEVYQNGQHGEIADVLTPYLRAGIVADDLRDASKAPRPMSDSGNVIPFSMYEPPPEKSSGLPFTVLPDDIQSMAGGVDKGAAEKMFNRLTGQLMKKVGGDSDAARSLIAGESPADWNSEGGKRIQAVMNCLNIPANWREPDFIALRDAYPLHERRRRNPNARLYPGDETLMAKVPDALTYLPVYGGRN